MSDTSAPPPVLGFARVLSYATVDADVQFTGRRKIYVDGTELGPVPRLALCQNVDDDDDEITLYLCDEEWNVLGVGGGADSLPAAKVDAEVSYLGIGRKWIDTSLSQDEARRWLEERFPSLLCSFCGRLPISFESLFRGHKSGICDDCVRRFHEVLPPEAKSDHVV